MSLPKFRRNPSRGLTDDLDQMGKGKLESEITIVVRPRLATGLLQRLT
jgi:hypothetical protein